MNLFSFQNLQNIILIALVLFPLKTIAAEYKTKTSAVLENFTEPLTEMEFVAVKGGCFQMGDSYGDGYTTQEGTSIEKPVHEVCVSNFFIGKYEVTVKQFQKFITETGYQTEAERNTGGLSGCYTFEFDSTPVFEYRKWANWKKPSRYFDVKKTYPVSCVSWNDAQAFVSWLTSKSQHKYRLPTEAEWEYAARGSSKSRNYWGDEKNNACRYANVADLTKMVGGRIRSDRHDCNDGYPYVAPVGQFKPNKFGLYDMMGNVWEWVSDRFDSRFYQLQITGNDPVGPKSGSTYVYRGGSWISGFPDVRVAFRPNLLPERRYYDVGFRLVSPSR